MQESATLDIGSLSKFTLRSEKMVNNLEKVDKQFHLLANMTHGYVLGRNSHREQIENTVAYDAFPFLTNM